MVTTWIFSCTNISLHVIYRILAAYILRIDDDVPLNIHIFIRKDLQYALICTTPLFYVLAATCFGSSLPSSGAS
jgi:hypothetical protein